MKKSVLTYATESYTARVYDAGFDERGFPLVDVEVRDKAGQSIRVRPQDAEDLVAQFTWLSSVIRDIAEEHERAQKQQQSEPEMKQSL